MKVLLAFIAGALLVPAAAEARLSSAAVRADASSQCGALRAEVGPSTFGATFSSFAACVSRLTPLERQNRAAAGALCRVRFPAASSPPRLFESCVITTTKSASLAEQQALNPARRCVLLRSSIGTAAFAANYGTGGDTAGALRDCLAATAGAQVAFETSSAATCRTEQEAVDFASAHGGKTFEQFYGANAAASNAFGRCVSLKAEAQISSPAGQTPTSTQGQQSGPQPSSTTTMTPTSTDPCTGGSGKPSGLMPSDCVPAGRSGGLR
jgi:hypothetical protein